MPVRNGEAFIERALDCILAQTFGDWRLLIGDNCSTDRTEEICRRYAERDRRIRYERHAENKGAAPNFNWVFRETRSEYFKWAAHDDELRPTYLEKTLAALERDVDVEIAHSWTDEIDADGRVTNTYDDQLPLVHDRVSVRVGASFRMTYPSPIWGVMRRRTMERTRLQGSYLGADWNFLAEMLMLGRLELVPERLFFVRNHDAGFSFGFQRTGKQTRQRWFDPKRTGPAILSAARSAYHFVEASLSHPMAPSERAACLKHVAWRTGRKAAGRVFGKRRPRPDAGVGVALAAGVAGAAEAHG